MELAQGNIGSEAKYELEIAGKDLVVKFDYKGAQLQSSHSLSLDLVAILNIVKAKIPGSIDDAIVSVVEAALLASSPAAAPL